MEPKTIEDRLTELEASVKALAEPKPETSDESLEERLAALEAKFARH